MSAAYSCGLSAPSASGGGFQNRRAEPFVQFLRLEQAVAVLVEIGEKLPATGLRFRLLDDTISICIGLREGIGGNCAVRGHMKGKKSNDRVRQSHGMLARRIAIKDVSQGLLTQTRSRLR